MTRTPPGRRAGTRAAVRRRRGAARRAAVAPVEVRICVPAASLPLPARTLRRRIARAVALTGFAGRVSVALVDDAAMRAVNRDFHSCDEPTDVLAFALDRPRGAPADAFDAEVVVSVDTARLEAAERGVSPSAEVLLYVVHGVLHLLGEDDHDAVAYRRMHARALAILAALGEANTIDPPEAKLPEKPPVTRRRGPRNRHS